MPISSIHKIIFVHIPKTSGTYIEAIFGMHGDRHQVGLQETLSTVPNEFLWGAEYQHLTISELRAILDPHLFRECFRFSIVRNPYDRIVSEIAWRSGHKSWQTSTEMTEDMFASQLKLIYHKYKRDRKLLEEDRHLMPQHRFVIHEGYLDVDRIFRYEEYDEVNAFIRKCGLACPREKRMTTSRWASETYLTEENKAMIVDMYADDFKCFDYSR